MPAGATDARRPVAAAAVVLALQGIAVAVWLLPASIHVVAWPDQGPSRVALLPPLSRLAWTSLAALALSASLVIAGRSRPKGRLVQAMVPCLAMWLWLVPYLPWLPDRWPLLLLLAGPLRWAIALAVVAMAASALRITSGPSDAGTIVRPGEETRPLRSPAAWVIFAISLALYLFFGLHAASAIGPAGDEPHYLVISHSLLTDGDLKIGDNHERGEYRAFYAGDLRPHFLRRGQDGEIYSTHAPGLGVLLAPAYAVAGYRGAVAMMCLIAALAATIVFVLCERLSGRGVACLVWLAACMTVPFVPHAWLLFPEMPATAIVALGLLWLWPDPPGGAGRWAIRGLIVGLLPWLHTKFIVLLAMFAVAAGMRLWRSPSRLAAFAAPVAFSVVAWLYYFYAIYGVIDPQAPYGSAVNEELSVSFIPRGLLGLLFDARLGLLWFAPVYLVALPGAWVLVRRPETRRLGLWLSAIAVAFVLSTTRFYMWWGGASAPARFLMPLVPCLAVMIAAALREWRGPAFRGFTGACLVTGVVIALTGSLWPEPRYFFSEPGEESRLLQLVQGPSALASAPPGFTMDAWPAPAMQLVPWAAAIAAAAGAMWWTVRVSAGPALRATGAGVIVWLVTVPFLAAPAPGARGESSARGRQDLVHAYDGEALTAYDYARRQRVSATDALESYPVTLEESGASAFLPQGAYEARVWFESSGDREGDLAIVTARRIEVGRVRGRLGNPASIPFSLPLTLGRPIVLVADGQAANEVTRIEFVPRAVTPRHQRESYTARAFDPIAGGRGAFIAYLDDRAYPEGGRFWTRSTTRTSVVVAPKGAERIILTVHLGPRSGDVVTNVAGVEHRLQVNESERRTLEIPVPPGTDVLPVSIQSTTEFRPSSEDPASTDPRWLGAFVEVDVR
jgi:hypothetical protein